MTGLNQLEQQGSNQAGGCSGIVATFNLNVDNLVNVGNGDVVVHITALQGGTLIESISMSNDMTMDYPVCVEPGCYQAKIVANGANTGFICTLTIPGQAPIEMTYNSQNISFGTDLCITGCMQTDACNYDPNANISDYASCVFQQNGFDCDGNCLTSSINESTIETLSPFEFSEADCATYEGIGSPLNLAAFDNNGSYNIVIDNNGVYENTGQSGTYTIDSGCLVNYNGTQYTFDATTNELRSVEQEDYYYYYYGSTCYVGESLATSAPGCTDPTACNYDAAATSDDGSCEFLSCSGCTDVNACNYDATATIDDGSCDLISCAGCTDVNACNYDATATIDDGSCDLTSCSGCTDVNACNYDATATIDDGSCTYAAAGEDCDGNCLGDEITLDILQANNWAIAFGTCGSSNNDEGMGLVTLLSESTFEYESLEQVDGGIVSSTYEFNTCSLTFGEFEELTGATFFYDATLSELYLEIETDVCVKLVPLIEGCMFELACNYNPDAMVMDYTRCDFDTCQGCTYPDAENYNEMASIDDGSCIYGECVTCMGDFNNDGAINSGDLLVFLGVFGGTCEEN